MKAEIRYLELSIEEKRKALMMKVLEFGQVPDRCGECFFMSNPRLFHWKCFLNVEIGTCVVSDFAVYMLREVI